MPQPERDAAAARPRVLVTGAGGPAAVAFLRAVADADVELFAADIDPYAAGLYLVPAGRRVLLPRGDAEGFVRALLSVCSAERIDIVVPTVDSELLPLARARRRFEARGVRPILASIETLSMSLDKWRLANVCRDVVLVPWTKLVDDRFDAACFDGAFIVKPRTGSGSRGVRLVESPADMNGVSRDGSMIAQDYLPGEEYSLDVLATTDGRVVAVVPRIRLKVDSGVSVAGRTLRDPELESFGLRVAERIGLTTVANVQCRRDARGRPALLEVNPRFSGAMPLTIASGVNMPLLALQDALGRRVPDAVAFREMAMVRFLDERFPAIEEMRRLEHVAAGPDSGAEPASAVGAASA